MLQLVQKVLVGSNTSTVIGRNVSRRGTKRETLLVGAACTAMVILSLPAATTAAPLLNADGTRNRCLPPFCYATTDPSFEALGAATDTTEWNLLEETSIEIDLPPNEYYSQTTLGVEPPENDDFLWNFGNYTYDYGDCPLSELVYDVTPIGIEASYPEETNGCLRPRVWIPFEGTFQLLGFRIIVPSKHTLGGTEFAAELQVIHGRVADDDVWNREHYFSDDEIFNHYKSGKSTSCSTSPTPFLVLSVMIDSNSDAAEGSLEAFEQVLVEWQTALDSHEASCHGPGVTNIASAQDTVAESAAPNNPNTDSLAVASSMAGRGNDADFVNGPIRRRRASDGIRTPYDLFVPSVVEETGTSYYVYGTGTSECNELVLWNLAEEPLEIPRNELAKMMVLVLGYNDANCSAFKATAIPMGSPWSENEAVQTRNPSRVEPSNKISWITDWCLEDRMGLDCINTVSESAPRMSLGMVVAILAISMATLFL